MVRRSSLIYAVAQMQRDLQRRDTAATREAARVQKAYERGFALGQKQR
jgi:hypothetical protein